MGITLLINGILIYAQFPRNTIGRKARLNSTCLRGCNVMEASSKKTATYLTGTPDHKAFVIYQVETKVLNRLIIIELYDFMRKLIH
jgi:hypothetical protein